MSQRRRINTIRFFEEFFDEEFEVIHNTSQNQDRSYSNFFANLSHDYEALISYPNTDAYITYVPGMAPQFHNMPNLESIIANRDDHGYILMMYLPVFESNKQPRGALIIWNLETSIQEFIDPTSFYGSSQNRLSRRMRIEPLVPGFTCSSYTATFEDRSLNSIFAVDDTSTLCLMVALAVANYECTGADAYESLAQDHYGRCAFDCAVLVHYIDSYYRNKVFETI